MTEPPISLLRLPAVLQRTGLSRSQLYRLIAAGKFAPPHHLAGTRASAWSSEDVNQWIRQQIGETA